VLTKAPQYDEAKKKARIHESRERDFEAVQSPSRGARRIEKAVYTVTESAR